MNKADNREMCLDSKEKIFQSSPRVVAYITQKDDKKYLYDKEALTKSIVEGSELYKDYQEGELIALKTDKGDYIDYRDIQKAMDREGSDLDVDSYVGRNEAKRIYIRSEEVKWIEA